MTALFVGPLPAGVPVRLPWAATLWDETLRRVNETAEARSTAAIECWIPGLVARLQGDIEDVSVHECAGPVGALYGREDLARDLARTDVLDSLRIYHDGELIPIQPFLQRSHLLHRPGVINTPKVVGSLAEGYTFNIGSIDRWHPQLNELAEHLERVIGGPAETYAFLSGGATPASPLHFDQPELLIVPTEGEKFWDVRRSAYRFAMGPKFVDRGEPPRAFGAVVAPGQAVVVPRGWLHKAAPVGPMSICLTFGLFRGFLARSAATVADGAVEVAELRRPATMGWNPNGALAGDGVEASAPAVAELFTPDRLAGAMARVLAELPARNDGPAAWELAEGGGLAPTTRLRARVPGGFLPVDVDGPVVACAGGDRLVVAPVELAPVLGSLLAGDDASIEEVVASTGRREETHAAAVALVIEGLLDIVELR